MAAMGMDPARGCSKTRALGTLMILHGFGQALFLCGVLYLMWGIRPPDLAVAGTLVVLGIALGAALAFAGLSVLECRRRRLALILLVLNLSMLFTAWCAPSAIALTLYGLLILTRKDDQGHTLDFGERLRSATTT